MGRLQANSADNVCLWNNLLRDAWSQATCLCWTGGCLQKILDEALLPHGQQGVQTQGWTHVQNVQSFLLLWAVKHRRHWRQGSLV